MDLEIFYLWRLDIDILMLLSVLLCISMVSYCYIKINHYNSILNSKHSNRYNYVAFFSVGTIFAIIAYSFFRTDISFMLAYLLVLLLSMRLYELKLPQALFLTSDFILITLLTGGIVPALISILYSNPINLSAGATHSLEMALAFFLGSVIVYVFNMKNIKVQDWQRFINSSKQLNKMAIFQLILITILAIFTCVYNYDLPMIFSYYQFFFMIILTIAYRMLIDYIVKASSADAYKLRCEIVEEQLQMQISNYSSQANYILEIRKFKHDYNSLMLVVNRLVENKEYEELSKFLEQTTFVSQKYFNMHKDFSNNLFIQAILYNAYQYCTENKIKCSGTVYFPEKLIITEIDLCKIFNNLLNNAMDACMKIDCDSRYIDISSDVKGKWFTLVLKNSFDGVVNSKNDTLHTTKLSASDHGFGTKIISDTVATYNGFVKYSWDKEEFTVSLHIPF